GVSTKTLRRWEAKGHILPVRTVGNQRRFSKAELLTLRTSSNGRITSPSAPQFSSNTSASPISGPNSTNEESATERPVVVLSKEKKTIPWFYKKTLFAGAVA